MQSYIYKEPEMEERIYNPSYFEMEELKKRCGIYQIRNLVNNKIYIGSSKTLARRFQIHINSLRKGKHENFHLQQAFNKYGENNFIFEIIEFCELPEQYKAEQYWINRFFGKGCYNINPEAIKPPDGTGRKVVISEAQKKQLSEIQKKRFQNSEERLKMSLLVRGKNMNEANKWSRPVVCLETGKEYPCISEAERQTSISRSCISECCLKHSHVASGTHWMYREEYEKLSEAEIKHILLTDNTCSQVVCLETKEIYPSLKEVVKKFNLYSSSQISLCCQGKLNSVRGFHWAYYEDYLKMSPEEINSKLKLKVGNSEAIYCVETRQIFPSITKAGKELKMDRNIIAECCKGLRNANPQGYHFLYAQDYETMSEEDRNKFIQKQHVKKRIANIQKVRCIETGQVFESVADALKAMGMDPRNSHISACCRGKRKTAGGYHWQYI